MVGARRMREVVVEDLDLAVPAKPLLNLKQRLSGTPPEAFTFSNGYARQRHPHLSFELRDRSLVVRHAIEVGHSQAGISQALADRSNWQARVVLQSSEALLLGSTSQDSVI